MFFILDVKIDALTRAQALDRVAQLFRSRGQYLITTPNPEIIVAARRDHEFRHILNQAALALPDGVGLMWAGKLLGIPFRERIAGSDFVWDIARLAAENGYSIYLLGGGEGVAAAAAEKFKTQDSRLKIVGAESGHQYNNEAVPPIRRRSGLPIFNVAIQRINDARPDILLVALGHGKQEKWIAAHLAEMPSVKIAMGVGGAFDFIAGRVRRAPRLLRAVGLEWLWRLMRQPWRLLRICRAVVIFPFFVIKSRLKQ